MTVYELARETLAVLDKQAEYFKTRDRVTLIASKQMEKQLRMKCTLEIVKGDKQGVLAS
jgi:hypothetical protein